MIGYGETQPSKPEGEQIPLSPVIRPEGHQAGSGRGRFQSVAFFLVGAAAAWYLLKELGPVLQPLLLAIFLCYFIVPSHFFLKHYIPGAASMFVLVGLTAGLLFLLALMIYTNVVALNEELPQLIQKAGKIVDGARRFYQEHLPFGESKEATDPAASQARVAGRVQLILGSLINVAAETLTEALVVGIYLIFILLEVGRLQSRVFSQLSRDRAEQILTVTQRINQAMADYLRVKVKASLILAMPATLVLWAFGVRFAGMWGMLTFLGNFIPYLGSIFSCSLPCLWTFLQFDSPTTGIFVAVLLVLIHGLSAYLIEPAMTGRAVGLSPLVILAALSFWGLCWGVTGMFLAIPLTSMLKIVLENIDASRPIAGLMAEE